jgi:hypothetical protein
MHEKQELRFANEANGRGCTQATAPCELIFRPVRLSGEANFAMIAQ